MSSKRQPGIRFAAVAAALVWLAGSVPAALAAGAAPDRAQSVEAVESAPLTAEELETLVGPVALYPDDLLAIVLPAATYPLQIVEADRYLEALEDDPTLEPDPDWNESVVALLNYPEVVSKLAADLDWTWELGRAVMDREQALLAAVDRFRRDAYAAGNLSSDRHQKVHRHEQAIEIRPADPAVIYVPYYRPELVRVRHSYPVYHYYQRPCPVYYYPYPVGHYLMSDRFWGVTSAFSIGWKTGNLHLHLLEHRSHPYYGYSYASKHYRYWRPRLMQIGRYREHPAARYHPGNQWRPERYQRGARPHPGSSPRHERRLEHRGDPGSLVQRAVREAQRRDRLERRQRAQSIRAPVYRGADPGASGPSSAVREAVDAARRQQRREAAAGAGAETARSRAHAARVTGQRHRTTARLERNRPRTPAATLQQRNPRQPPAAATRPARQPRPDAAAEARTRGAEARIRRAHGARGRLETRHRPR